MAPLLTRRDVATSLKVSLSKVDDLIETGKLPALKIDKSVRVRASDLEEFIAGRVTARAS